MADGTLRNQTSPSESASIASTATRLEAGSETTSRMSPEDVALLLSAIQDQKSEDMVRFTRLMARSTVIYTIFMALYTAVTIALWRLNDYSLEEIRKANEVASKANEIAGKALEESRKANDSYEKSLQESVKSNMLSEKSLEEAIKYNKLSFSEFMTKNRPYIAISSVKYNKDSKKRSFGVRFNIKNYGNIPAYIHEIDLKVLVDGEEYPIGVIDEFNKSIFPQVEYYTSRIIEDSNNLYSKITNVNSKVDFLYDIMYRGNDERDFRFNYKYRYVPKGNRLYLIQSKFE